MSEEKKLRVGIVMGSKSDKSIMLKAKAILDRMGVGASIHIASAHRSPNHVRLVIEAMIKNGSQVLIAGAGMAAHLAGAVVAQTTLPVIGVPLSSSSSPFNGQDALLSTVQMPPGMPVATVGIDMAENAAWLAVQILAISDESLRHRLQNERRYMTDAVIASDDKFQQELAEGLKEAP